MSGLGVHQRVGYVMKQVTALLRTRMDEQLNSLGLTVSQYACLELLGERPGMSNADLARGVFVSRQSMNLVLRGLQDRGLVSRPDVVAEGRRRPSELTAEGHDVLAEAKHRISRVEKQLVRSLSKRAQQELLHSLHSCAADLAEPAGPV